MFHKLGLFTLVLILSACSPATPENGAMEVEVEALAQLAKVSGDGSLGAVASSKTVIFAIANSGDGVSEIPTATLTGAQANAFSIINTSGCSAGLGKNAVCSVRVNFSASGKAAGEYEASLQVGASLIIPLAATVAPAATTAYSISENSLVLAGINFGNLSRTQVVQKILTLKNTSSVNSPALALALNNSHFALSNNTCEGKILKPAQTCSFKLIFSTAGKSAQVYLADLSFADQLLPLSGAVVGIPPAGSPESGVEIATYVNNEALSAADLNLGLFPNNQGVVKIITFKNMGDETSEPLTATINDLVNFSLISNTCINRVLAPQADCSVRLVFSAVGKPEGAYTVSLSFAGDSKQIGADVLSSAACPAGAHLEAPNCVNNIQPCSYANGTGQKIWANGAYGACNPIACDSGFDLANNQCLTVCAASEHRNPASFVCEANVINCAIANAASATQTWNGSAYGSCQVVACNASFHNESNACVSDVRVCAIANGSGSQSWNGSTYGSCQVATCNSAYHIEGNACVDDVRACAMANGTGSQQWVGNQYSECTVLSCNGGYHHESNACVNDIRSCAIAHGQGQQTWEGAAYGTCMVLSCESTYHNEGNACLSDVQSCSIANAASASKTWNGSGYTACVVGSCNSGFEIVNNQCLSNCSAGNHRNFATEACDADVISCVGDIANATAATRTWNGSAYGSCIVSACQSTYHVQSNQCAANVADCTAEVPRASAATKTWNGSSYGTCTPSACASGFSVATNLCSPSSSASANASYTAAGSFSFTVPTGVTKIMIVGAGGGGSGGGSNLWSGGGSGGGGGANYSRELLSVNPGEIYTINIGNGGAAPVSAAQSGNSGGSSSIVRSSTLFSWNGGSGGGGGNSGGVVGAGGSGAGNGGRGGNGGSPYGYGQAGSLGSLTIFSGVTAGAASGNWYSGGGGGGGGSSLGSGGRAGWVGVYNGDEGACGGGGGGVGGNDTGGGIPMGYKGGDGCVFIYYGN